MIDKLEEVIRRNERTKDCIRQGTHVHAGQETITTTPRRRAR